MAIRTPTLESITAAVSLDTTPVVVGVAVNIEGYSEVTLYILSAATSTNDCTIEVFVDPDDTTAPVAETNMNWVKTITVDVSEQPAVAAPITVCGKWLLIMGSHASAAANITVDMMGVAAMT